MPVTGCGKGGVGVGGVSVNKEAYSGNESEEDDSCSKYGDDVRGGAVPDTPSPLREVSRFRV